MLSSAPAQAEVLKHKSYISPKKQTPIESQEEVAARIWERYKALAAGQDPDQIPETPPADNPVQSEPSQSPQAPSDNSQSTQNATGATGTASLLGAILQQAQDNKQKQGHMRTLVITPPTPPEGPQPPKVVPPQ